MSTSATTTTAVTTTTTTYSAYIIFSIFTSPYKEKKNTIKRKTKLKNKSKCKYERTNIVKNYLDFQTTIPDAFDIPLRSASLSLMHRNQNQSY